MKTCSTGLLARQLNISDRNISKTKPSGSHIPMQKSIGSVINMIGRLRRRRLQFSSSPPSHSRGPLYLFRWFGRYGLPAAAERIVNRMFAGVLPRVNYVVGVESIQYSWLIPGHAKLKCRPGTLTASVIRAYSINDLDSVISQMRSLGTRLSLLKPSIIRQHDVAKEWILFFISIVKTQDSQPQKSTLTQVVLNSFTLMPIGIAVLLHSRSSFQKAAHANALRLFRLFALDAIMEPSWYLK